MLKRKDRTMERYMKAGAEMRLFKTLAGQIWTDLGPLLSAVDRYKFRRAINKIDEVCSNAEDNMYFDHPYIDDKYIDVFYGSTQNEPRSEFDENILKIARETADELFTGKGY